MHRWFCLAGRQASDESLFSNVLTVKLCGDWGARREFFLAQKGSRNGRNGDHLIYDDKPLPSTILQQKGKEKDAGS